VPLLPSPCNMHLGSHPTLCVLPSALSMLPNLDPITYAHGSCPHPVPHSALSSRPQDPPPASVCASLLSLTSLGQAGPWTMFPQDLLPPRGVHCSQWLRPFIPLSLYPHTESCPLPSDQPSNKLSIWPLLSVFIPPSPPSGPVCHLCPNCWLPSVLPVPWLF
jgi:DNA-binding transcriptional LysR family regulator